MHATVTATYSRRMRLRLDDGRSLDARIKGKRLKPVCGDRVACEPLDGEDGWLITGIDERRNSLTRPNLRGKTEVLAANLDKIVVVAAARPEPDWYVVDRYLCAAELMAADAAVVYNKTDLGTEDTAAGALRVYAALGYPMLTASAATGERVDELAAFIAGGTAIIVGQSGVGKSSLINCLAGSEQKTASVSDKSGEGKHTTVNSVMIELPAGGAVIDSPGVRDYAPALASSDEAETGFREICAAAPECRFANCRHLREPNCAVKAGVTDGRIDQRRYESYKRIVNLTERLQKDRY